MVYLPDPYFFRKMSKSCSNPDCEQENPQPLSEFLKRKKGANGLHSKCKECVNAYRRKRHKDAAVRKRDNQRCRAYMQSEEAKKKRRIRINARGRTDWERLKEKFGGRLRKFVKRGQDSPSNQELFGCTRAEMCAHIEDQFKDGMSWDNYGKVWDFDHIVPYKAFPTVEELEKHHKIVCWYKNVRPLPVPDNRGDKREDYDEEDKQALIRRFQLWEIQREVLSLI